MARCCNNQIGRGEMATFLLFPLLFTEAITEIYGDAVPVRNNV